MSIELLYCRLCAKQKSSNEILDLVTDLTKRSDVIEKLSFALNYVDFSDKSLPETVCNLCYNTLNVFYEFFAKIKYSQVILKLTSNRCKTEHTINRTNYELENNLKKSEANIKVELEMIDEPIKTKLAYNSNEDTNKANLYNDNGLKSIISNNQHQIYTDTELSGKTTINEKKLSYTDGKISLCPAPTYGGIPVFLNDKEVKQEELFENGEFVYSWTGYKWQCYHCKEQFNIMEEVRTHSKEVHNMCYGFSCADCKAEFNTFNAFIEHVRQHREMLRYSCQYCNVKFETQSQCFDHTITHWDGMQKICDLCGEILPDQSALQRHKKLYKKVSLCKNIKRRKPKIVHPNLIYASIPVSKHTVARSWESYTWSCQECSLRLPDVAMLRSHTQEIHNKCFSMKCMDCLNVMTNYRMFVSHVTKHRPYLKQYCQYCNVHFEDIEQMNQHIKEHITSSRKPCDGCGHIFQDKTQLLKHMKEYDAPRLKGTLTKEDLTCDHCNKYCKTLYTLRQHRKTHYDRERQYVCDTCGKAYLSQTCLMEHVKRHNNVTETCKICRKVFHSRQNLKAHVKTHSVLRPFRCDKCEKSYKTKKRLNLHLVSHSDIKRYECKECEKTFKYSSNLKDHEHQHTGIRPYACQVCEKTFNSWANCNKHMVRKHGTSLAKTKMTPQGRIPINHSSGKPEKLLSNQEAQEWMNAILKDVKRCGRPKKSVTS